MLDEAVINGSDDRSATSIEPAYDHQSRKKNT